jgi:hypothetical protein
MTIPMNSGGYYVRDFPAGKSLSVPEIFVEEKRSRDIL